MKTNSFIKSSLISIFAIMFFCSCANNIGPSDDLEIINEIKEKLSDKYWGMYQAVYVTTDSAILPPSPTYTYYLEQGEVNRREQVRENEDSYLPVFYFEDKIMKEGYSYYGIVRYSLDNMPYKIYKDSLNDYWIEAEEYQTASYPKIYRIAKLTDDELVIEQYLAYNVRQFNYLRTIKDSYYFKNRDFAPLMEKYNNISALLVGKWMQLEQHTSIDYFDGYTSADGQRHIDNTITHASSYPYLEITDEQGFRTGTYTDGKIEYYIAPDAPAGNDGLRSLSQSLDAEGNYHLTLRSYHKDNSNAYYIVDEIDDETLLMHIPVIEYKTVGAEQVQICEGKIAEIWKRIK